MIPLYVFVDGDVLGLALLADPGQTVDAFIAQIQRAARVRVRPREGMSLRFKDRPLPGGACVGALGLAPLDRVDLVKEVS
ncbi:MAG: hypothetical protein ACHREM_08520 [Polyangiales bacterium]